MLLCYSDILARPTFSGHLWLTSVLFFYGREWHLSFLLLCHSQSESQIFWHGRYFLVDGSLLLLWPRVTPWRVACATFGLPCVTTCATIKHHPLHLLVQQVGMRQKQNPKRPKLPLGGFEKNAFLYVAVAEKPLSDFSQGTLYGKVFWIKFRRSEVPFPR